MLKIERSLSDAIAAWLRAQTGKLDKKTLNGRCNELAATVEKLVDLLRLSSDRIYLMSTVAMDTPRNRGEYIQLHAILGNDLMVLLRRFELPLSLAVTDPRLGSIASILLEDSDEGGYEVTVDFYGFDLSESQLGSLQLTR